MNSVEISNVTKTYKKHAQVSSNTLRDQISSFFQKKKEIVPQELFLALDDVSFNVGQGDVVGLIGRNGAGKSTLLKILSSITTPTKGEIKINGRVGSLLEVGTGFHPELTGRENVFINGSILGLSKSEIHSKFDAIVDFSGVEDFLDTPVKRYSSGMIMRLAFSVAAHIEPEILVVDEVLAVGDADFQKKCLGKMKEVSAHGRTVFFVTHNMSAVSQLCNKVAHLQKGKLVSYGSDVDKIISNYLFDNDTSGTSMSEVKCRGAIDNEFFKLLRFRAVDNQNQTISSVVPNDCNVAIEIEIDLKIHHPALNFGFALINQNGVTVFWSVTTDEKEDNWPSLKIGTNILKCNLPIRFLNEGSYRVDLFSSIHASGYFSQPSNTEIGFNLNIFGGLSDSPYWRSIRPGIVAPVLKWNVV